MYLVKTLERFLPSIHTTAFGFLTVHQPSCPWPLCPKTDLFQRNNRKKILEDTHLSTSHNAVCICASCKMCSFIHKCSNTGLLSAACVSWSLRGGEVLVLYYIKGIAGSVLYVVVQSHRLQMFKASHRWKLQLLLWFQIREVEAIGKSRPKGNS